MVSRGVLNGLLLITLAGLLGLCALVLVVWGPVCLFREPETLRLGILISRDNPDLSQKLLTPIQAAVEDINLSISRLSHPRPPKIKLVTSSESTSCYQQLYDLATGANERPCNAFMALCTTNELHKLDNLLSEEANLENIPIDLMTPSPWVDKQNKKSQESQLRVLSTGLNIELEAHTYLALLNETNPTGKVFYVVPLVADNDPSAKAFYDALLSKLDHFPDLRFTHPVNIENTEYPKSDAFQAISDLGQRANLHPNSHILLLTSSIAAARILDTAHVNRALRRHRWFLRASESGLSTGAGDIDTRLESFSGRAQRTAQIVSLTVLAFLADGGETHQVTLRTKALDSISEWVEYNSEQSHNRLSLWAESQAYENTMLLHRLYTNKIFFGHGQLFHELSDEGPYNEENKRTTGLVVSMTFNDERRNVSCLPNLGWVLDRLFEVNETSEAEAAVNVHDIPTHMIRRGDIVSTLKKLPEESCSNPELFVKLPRTILTPEEEGYAFSMEDFSSALIVPVQKDLLIEVHCPITDSAEDQQPLGAPLARIYCFHTNQERYDPIECSVEVNGQRLRQKARWRREEQRQDEASFLGALSDSVLPTWRSLAPSVFSCAGSVAGCDFCLYFFTTYNVSAAHPNVCIGGCALGTVGSCTSLVGQALLETSKMLE